MIYICYGNSAPFTYHSIRTMECPVNQHRMMTLNGPSSTVSAPWPASSWHIKDLTQNARRAFFSRSRDGWGNPPPVLSTVSLMYCQPLILLASSLFVVRAARIFDLDGCECGTAPVRERSFLKPLFLMCLYRRYHFLFHPGNYSRTRFSSPFRGIGRVIGPYSWSLGWMVIV